MKHYFIVEKTVGRNNDLDSDPYYITDKYDEAEKVLIEANDPAVEFIKEVDAYFHFIRWTRYRDGKIVGTYSH